MVDTNRDEELESLRDQLNRAAKRTQMLELSVLRAEERFNAFTSTLPGISWETWGRPDEVPAAYVSPSVEKLTGYPAERWSDQSGFWLDLVHPEDRAQAQRELIEMANGTADSGTQEYRWILQDGRILWMHVRFCIVRDDSGAPVVWQAFSLDVTAQKMAEIERDRLLLDQSHLLTQLSTPLIPISEDVVVMPLIGPVDRLRADKALETLLAGLAAQHARVAILDVTGVPKIDADVVNALMRAAQATRLLGVDVMLTGIRAEVAQAFCESGQDLVGINTCANLKQGIARAMKRKR